MQFCEMLNNCIIKNTWKNAQLSYLYFDFYYIAHIYFT